MSSEKYTLVEGGILVRSRLSADIDEPYQLFLDATAVRKLDDQEGRNATTARILALLDESNIGYRPQGREVATDLEVQIGYTSVGYGVFRMDAEIARPSVSDEIATRVATDAMRQMAHDLGTYPDEDIPSLVYAQVSGLNGITLETNPVGACSMDTDGTDYDEDSEKIKLYDHNLYTHEMQLICIAGLIALAKAR